MTRDQPGTDIEHALRQLLEERRQLLVYFCRAAGLNTAGEAHVVVDQLAVLKPLCQLLMDYYALWQFEIHDYLTETGALYPHALAELQQASEILDQSRVIAVAFNDKYDFESRSLNTNGLENDLSVLGEEIAQQIGVEDRIIRAMGTPH